MEEHVDRDLVVRLDVDEGTVPAARLSVHVHWRLLDLLAPLLLNMVHRYLDQHHARALLSS